MKITCSETEKERILEAFHRSDICPFKKCKELIIPAGKCDECCERRIEWQIVNDDD